MSHASRPKLLFLAWNFPPVQNIASVRTWNIAKHLSRLGWDVTVVTPKTEVWRHLDNLDKVDTDVRAEGIRKICTDHRLRFLNPDHLICWNDGLGWVITGIARRFSRSLAIDCGIGWVRVAEQACKDLDRRDVDLILGSGPPFSVFMLAERLGKRLSRPYVLDYRDVWTERETDGRGLRSTLRVEATLLARAAGVVAVSPALAAHLDCQFDVGSKLQVVTNGFDPEELDCIKRTEFDHFAIVYAGIFYPPERVITPLLHALKRLDANGQSIPWYFHYYGDHSDHVRDEAIKVGLLNRMTLHGRVPRSEALSAIRGANLALVISSVLDKGSLKIDSIPGKLFEVVGLGPPTLLITPQGSDAESIARSAGPVGCFRGSDIPGIASFIEHLMLGSTAQKGNDTCFEWQQIARTLDIHLRKYFAKSMPHNKSLGIHQATTDTA